MSKAFAKAFYNSHEWIRTRDAYIAERTLIDGGMCECCHVNVGEELHHIVPLTPANIDDYDICLNPCNLKWLCKDCHFKAHRELILKAFEKSRERRGTILHNGCYMDDNGYMVLAKRFIVWGAPASGKTTYVRGHMERGDLVVDLDEIKAVLSFGADDNDNLLPVALSVRECLYSLIESGKADCRNVWVIACLPRREERTKLAERLNAEFIHMDADYRECIRRAGEDKEHCNVELRRAAIDRYFEAFEE